MRELAVQIIREAAAAAGLVDVDSTVMEKPEKAGILEAVPRVELEYLAEELERVPRRIAKFDSVEHPGTHRTVRKQSYIRRFSVRAEVVCEDETELETLVVGILRNLPAKTADSTRNLVRVTANRAVRGGFGSRMVEVFKRRSNALHIVFEGRVTADEDVALIREVNLVDGVSVGGEA